MRQLRISLIILALVIIVVIILAVCFTLLPRRKSAVAEDVWRSQADRTLVLSHVLLRHGNRVPNNQAYSKNPINSSSFFREGYQQISEAGKKVAYRIGTSLHQRYSWFLSPTWNIKYIEARTTNLDRTKMSLQLMLAGLWPPTGFQVVDPLLSWQPIPFNTTNNDKELESYKFCTNFDTLKYEVQNIPEIKQALSVYDPYWEYFSNMTGDNITTLQNVFDLCVDLHAQRTYGYPLEDWVEASWPIIEKITKDVYYIETNTTDLKKMAAGYLVKKMINDSRSFIDGGLMKEKKMFIYSAHERNLAFFLITLGVYNDDIPSYGSFILVELHLVDEVYGFKIYYQDWSNNDPQLMTMPGCQAFCPYDQFVSLMQDVIPEEDFCILP